MDGSLSLHLVGHVVGTDLIRCMSAALLTNV